LRVPNGFCLLNDNLDEKGPVRLFLVSRYSPFSVVQTYIRDIEIGADKSKEGLAIAAGLQSELKKTGLVGGRRLHVLSCFAVCAA